MMSEIFDDPGSAEQFRSSSRILKGLHIKGQVRGEENLVVDGQIDGPISLERGVLTITEKGLVRGDVVVPELIVHGRLAGNLHARDRVKITPKGSIVGDVTTARMMIEDGGYYRGGGYRGLTLIRPQSLIQQTVVAALLTNPPPQPSAWPNRDLRLGPD
jgi:cytoskeletal protein CcmA (bactofilin family)